MGTAAAYAIPAGPEIPAEWLDGLARLGALAAPSSFQAMVLLDARRAWRGRVNWIAAAAAAGWSTLEAFGAHPRAPAARHGCKGLFCALGHRAILKIERDAAWVAWQDAGRSGSHCISRFGAAPGCDSGVAECVPVWELVAS